MHIHVLGKSMFCMQSVQLSWYNALGYALGTKVCFGLCIQLYLCEYSIIGPLRCYTKVFRFGRGWLFTVYEKVNMFFLCKSHTNTFSPIKWYLPGRAPVQKILQAFVEIKLVLYFSYFVVQNRVICKYSYHRFT